MTRRMDPSSRPSKAPGTPGTPGTPGALAVCASDTRPGSPAGLLAAQLGWPCLSLDQAAGWLAAGGTVVDRDGDRLEVRFLEPGSPVATRVICDPGGGDDARRRLQGPGRDDLLLKAVGARRQPAPRVLDATAGFGRDAVLLAEAGCQVVACERTPVVRLLFSEALAQLTVTDPGLADRIASRLHIMGGSAVDYMASTEAADPGFDVVYLDPMHPPRLKSAQVRKQLRALQRLVGPDADADDLLAPALALARRRVVVKRPTHGDPLEGRAPHRQLRGQRVRFDIYDTAAGC